MQQYPDHSTITRLLSAWHGGDGVALDELMERVYGELQKIAAGYLRNERPDHTLEVSALVHEAYLRLLEQRPPEWHDRLHFFAIAARIMRRVLIDHARRSRYAKRGGGAMRVPLLDAAAAADPRPAALLALDEALRELGAFDRELATIVELRYFGGLTAEEIAAVLGVSVPTVTRRWRIARGWLYRRLTGDDGDAA
jgi:RNA polymerase sigma factor (TIGR02999 family)